MADSPRPISPLQAATVGGAYESPGAVDRFRQLADAMSMIVWAANAGGQVTYMNQSGLSLLGLSLAQVNDVAAMSELIHPDDFERITTLWPKQIRAGEPFTSEWRLCHRKVGQYRWLLVQATPVRNPDGSIREWFGTGTDIHDLKTAQQAASTRQEQLESILAHSPDVLCRWDRKHRYTFASSNTHALFGIASEQVIGKTTPEIGAPPALCDLARATAERVFVTGQPCDIQFELRVRSEQRRFEGRCVPELSPDGNVDSVLWITRNVTDKHQTERLLEEATQRFRVLTETVPDFVWSCTPDGQPDYVNPQYTAYTGHSVQTLAQNYSSAFHPDDYGPMMAQWARALELRKPFEAEYRIRRASDGAFRWFLNRKVPVFNDTGRLVRWVGSGTDVHDAKLAREERERLLAAERAARLEAEAASRVKDRFLAVLSHELRTPLTPVLLSASLLEHHPGIPEDARQDISIIRRNVEIEAQLIDDLLDLTRIARGKITFEFKVLDLHQHLRTAVAMYCADGKLAVELHLNATTFHINGDTTRIQQVIWNLLSNAWKFTPTGGRLALRTTNSRTGRIHLEIQDTGMGIEPHILSRIFDPFEQGDAPHARKFGGLGLGLSISKAFIEAHGGTIIAHSDGLDQGSRFVIELPAIAAPTEAPDAVPFAPTPVLSPVSAPSRALRVLLVEDHAITLKLMTRLLEQMGHVVVGVGSVADGIAAAGRQPLDLLISDLGLPDGTGYDLMRQLRQTYGLRGVALSGYGMEEDRHRSHDAGFSEHVVKPIDIRKLAGILARVADKPE